MKTSGKEIALTTIFKSSSYITNKHHKKIKETHNILNAVIFISSREQEKSLITV